MAPGPSPAVTPLAWGKRRALGEDYRSEGWFNVWHDGGVFRVEAFWPWSGQGRRPTGRAELREEPSSEFWRRGETQSGVRGWVLRDNERMLDLHALFPRGRAQGPTDCDARQ